jgi:hypothetical protein
MAQICKQHAEEAELSIPNSGRPSSHTAPKSINHYINYPKIAAMSWVIENLSQVLLLQASARSQYLQVFSVVHTSRRNCSYKLLVIFMTGRRNIHILIFLILKFTQRTAHQI